jgi:gliding motility associated protien GldN
MKQSSTVSNYKLHWLGLFILLFAFAQENSAQNATRPTRQRPSAADSSSVVNLTERARIKNEVESKKPSHIVWERMIYRNVDLTKETNNAALYYPVQPQGGRQNLFTLIFKLLSDNKIKAYRHVETGEVFEDSYKLNFEESLKSLQLSYTKQGERFVVDERDIPSMEVTQYMIKEGYYFDQATGMFQTTVLALCPLLVREDFYYNSNPSREALFWLKYDDLRPYLSREMIMTSDYNNALTYTMDDYFRKTMYTGEIVRTVNMMGKTLAQQVGNDSIAMKQAQDSIETQLKVFRKNLWVYTDSVRPATEKAQDKKGAEKPKTTSGRSSATGRSSTNAKGNAQKESKTQSAPKSETTPVRSVRRGN